MEAGVDPQFAVLDEAEARLLLRDAVREELLSGAGTSGDSPLHWLAGIGISRGIETLSGAMEENGRLRLDRGGVRGDHPVGPAPVGDPA